MPTPAAGTTCRHDLKDITDEETGVGSVRAADGICLRLHRGRSDRALYGTGQSGGDGGVAIVVETQTFYNDFKLGFWSSEAVAEVAFMLTARKPDGTLIYSRAYRAVGMNKEIMLMTGEAAEPALDEALRNAVLQVANDTDLQTALMAAR